MQNNLQRVLESMLAEALNKWAVFSQLSILLVLCLVFIVLWKLHKKKETFYWMLAWIMNFFGILIIYLVFEFSTLSNLAFKATFIIYSISKISFAFLLILGAYVLLNQSNIKRNTIILIPTGISLLLIVIVIIGSLNIIAIQALTYFIIGSLFLGSSIHYLKNKQICGVGLLLIGPFILESIVFLHHAWTMYLVYLGGSLPDYMKYVSFFDSLVELIIGMVCLLSISFRAINQTN